MKNYQLYYAKNDAVFSHFECAQSFLDMNEVTDSITQYRSTCRRKHTQNTVAPRATMIRTHASDVNAFSTIESHNQNHKIAKLVPNSAPTITWLTVCSCCETRSQDCKHKVSRAEFKRISRLVPYTRFYAKRYQNQ